MLTGGSRAATTWSESLALATGEGARQPTSAKIRYSDEPLARLKIVRDFPPPPEDLVFRDEGVKVTIAVSSAVSNSSRDEARRHDSPYSNDPAASRWLYGTSLAAAYHAFNTSACRGRRCRRHVNHTSHERR